MILIKELGPKSSIIKIDQGIYLSLPNNRLVGLPQNWEEALSEENTKKFFDILSKTPYEQRVLYIAEREDIKYLLVYKNGALERLEEVHDGDWVILSSMGEAQVVNFKIHKMGEIEGNKIIPLEITLTVDSE